MYCGKHDLEVGAPLQSHKKYVHYRGMERCIIEGKVEGKRRKGRPLTSWASDIVKLFRGNLADPVHQAVDRERWRALVMAPTMH